MAKLNEKQFAEDFGFALSFLKSSPELYKLFKKAVAGTWTSQKFVAAVQNTKWYKTHGDAYRKNLALQKTNPGEWKNNYNNAVAEVQDKARALGAHLTSAQLKKLTTNYLNFGWNDSMLNDAMSSYIRYSNATGQAQANISGMNQIAWRNGIKVSPSTVQKWARTIAEGDATLDDFTDTMRQQAMTLAPSYAQQLKAGMDLYDVASPYMQSMASTLEMNPADIDLFDPTIRQALSARDSKGKPTSKSLWDFEQGLRNDKRWLSTKNAQDQTAAVAHQVLSDFGFTN